VQRKGGIQKRKKEEMNPLENIRCHSYPKQWPPFGEEKL
jgi:hypothetical protein